MAGQRLLGLLNNLLDLAKLESGKMPFKMAPVDFSAVLEHALLEMQFAFAGKVADRHNRHSNNEHNCGMR